MFGWLPKKKDGNGRNGLSGEKKAPWVLHGSCESSTSVRCIPMTDDLMPLNKHIHPEI